MINYLKTLILVLTIGLIALNQANTQIATVYSENFTGQNGDGLTGPLPVPAPPVTPTAGWTASGGTLTATTDWFVVNNDLMEARDVDTEVSWTTPSFTNNGTLCYEFFQYSFNASEQGTMEPDDYLRSSGVAAGITTAGADLSDDFTSNSYTSGEISLNCADPFFVEIVIDNGAGSEYHRFDDVIIEACTAKPTLNSATPTCNGTMGEINVSATLPSCSNGTLEYNIGTGWQLSSSFTGLDNGTYSVQVRNSLLTTCCMDDVSVEINCVPAPVELVEFEGQRINSQVQLNWETASELNNSGFEVQKSLNGQNWNTIDFVKGLGTTNEVNQYDFIDDFPFLEKSYYRLKQIDFDGAFEYSNVIAINYDSSKRNITVFPNPSNGMINLQIDNPSEKNVKIQILNNLGAKIWESELAVNEYNLNRKIEIEENGIYLIIAQIGDETIIEKVIINK